MQDLPHHYHVTAALEPEQFVSLSSPGLEPIESAGPAEFGGPGDLWSPETLLIAAVAECLLLSFKAVARAGRLEWAGIRCDVEGVLERVDGKTRFTEIIERVTLDLPAGGNADKAMRLLTKAEKTCLITNSLNADVHMEADIRVAGSPAVREA
mgnify:CR=1 FL=1